MRWTAVTLLLASCCANAAIITFDPTTYGLGTNISHVQDGLTVSQLSWPEGSPPGAPLPATRSDVYASQCADVYYACMPGGNLGFGFGSLLEEYEPCVGGSISCYGPSVLEFTFRDLTDSVSLTFTWGSDAPGIFAYDISGNLLARCVYSTCGTLFDIGQPDGHGTTLTINRDQRDIYRIVAGGYQGRSFAHGLSYSIPEPATLTLLTLGLLGLAVRRRRG